MRISELYYKLKPNLVFCIALPAYVILFVTIFSPSLKFYDGWNEGWNTDASLCLPIMAAIELLTVLLSRLSLCFLPFPHTLNRTEYFFWLVLEILISSLFVDLFLSIFLHRPYFDLLPSAMLSYLCLNIIPYVIFWMSMLLKEQYMQMAEVEKELMELRKGAERNEAGMIRFNDEKGNTKLVVSADRVISLESAGNYVNILYDNDGKLVRYSLRNTLKGIEKVCNSNGLIRCHRSYFVNLNKIKVIRRTSEGVYAEMDVHNVGDIPVSKTYASDLLRLFSES